jgi:hypothetical protein
MLVGVALCTDGGVFDMVRSVCALLLDSRKDNSGDSTAKRGRGSRARQSQADEESEYNYGVTAKSKKPANNNAAGSAATLDDFVCEHPVAFATISVTDAPACRVVASIGRGFEGRRCGLRTLAFAAGTATSTGGVCGYLEAQRTQDTDLCDIFW